MDQYQKIIILNLASKYLKENPERFTTEKIIKFKSDLNTYLNNQSNIIDDEIYDFLVDCHLIKNRSRVTQFARYINSKYSPTTTPNILDVGAGRMCHLSHRLIRSGYNVTSIDPKIRLTDNEAKTMGIDIIKENFYCDEFTPLHKQSSIINNQDLLVGLEPCDATEHIIRQSLKYNKPFEVLLCYTAHKTLLGKTPKSTQAWYEYLQSISNEVKINKVEDSYIATNN